MTKEYVTDLDRKTNAFKSLEVAFEFENFFQDKIAPLCKEENFNLPSECKFTKQFFISLFKQYIEDLSK